MNRRLIFVLLLAAVAGAHAPARAADRPLAWSLQPLSGRTSDEVIARDLAAIDAWRAHLDALASGTADPWRTVSARAWLEAARDEYTDNDETGFDRAAFERARANIQAIESGTPPPSPERPMRWEPITGSTQVRPDLWETLEQLKRSKGYPCVVEELARLEVSLARAGNEQIDQGDCHASPHVAAAERWAHEARLKAAACGEAPTTPAPKVPEPVAIPKPTTVPAPALEIPTAEELRIPRDVHFAVNSSRISAQSRAVIEGIVDLLDKYPSITVLLVGHTDSRGSVEYNERLSRRRVNAVRDVMVLMGIDTNRITVDHRGESELMTSEEDVRDLALNRRVEMLFVDREGLEIKAERQEGDLQLER